VLLRAAFLLPYGIRYTVYGGVALQYRYSSSAAKTKPKTTQLGRQKKKTVRALLVRTTVHSAHFAPLNKPIHIHGWIRLQTTQPKAHSCTCILRILIYRTFFLTRPRLRP